MNLWAPLIFIRCNLIIGHTYMENRDKEKTGFAYKCLYCGSMTNFRVGG